MKTIVITGASSGLGEELTRRFAAEGHQVCALARSVDKLEKLKAECPDNILPFPLDLADRDAIKKCFQKIEQQFDTVDLLINNAGFADGGRILDGNWDDVSNVIDVNLKGAMYCCYAVIPLMIRQKSGRIINISSVAAIPGGPMSMFDPENPDDINVGAYAVSKAGMNAIAENLGKTLHRNNITMTTVMPGAIDTPLWYNDNGVSRYPIKDAKLMQPSEVADLICFIASQPNHICYKTITLFPICEWK